MPRMKRRHFAHRMLQTSAFAALSPASAADLSKPAGSEGDAIRLMANEFLREHSIQGMGIAYGRDGQVAFEAGYGFADAEKTEAVTPEHRFRIASISKPITATAVMMNIEKGRLKLGDKVFGPLSILGDTYGRDLPKSVLAITVDHLLTHMSGGWANDKNDPMFLNRTMNHDELITWTLANQKQTHQPGEHHAYSNFGYCVLGRVLEKAGRSPYETLVTQQVLSKCGVTDMKIAGNTLVERQPGEVRYLTQIQDAAYGMNVARMDAHGGWIATASDLVRFASQLPKLLNAGSIRTMTTAVSESYARGWNVNNVPNWWHTGSLPGTTTIMVHTAKGICWAGLLNGRKEGIGLALDLLMWKLGREVKAWNV